MDYTTLQADVDFLVDTDSNTYSVASKTRNFNIALDEITGVIIGCDGTWQWDDSNYTDYPIGTAPLVSGQTPYVFASEHLVVNEVEIKDTSGVWHRLKPIDLFPEYNIRDKTSITSFMSTSGIPEYYDKQGASLFIYPAPNYSQADSLKVFFQRKAEPFTVSDTTKKPGFATHLHRVLSLCVAYDWAVIRNPTKLGWLLSEKNRYIQLIKDFYSTRTKDESRRIKVTQQNNK